MRAFFLTVAVVWALCPMGCRTGVQGEAVTRPEARVYTHEISRETEYYRDSPAQARPPDGRFSSGVKVIKVQEAGSYTRVRSEKGIEGYVTADALRALP